MKLGQLVDELVKYNRDLPVVVDLENRSGVQPRELTKIEVRNNGVHLCRGEFDFELCVTLTSERGKTTEKLDTKDTALEGPKE